MVKYESNIFYSFNNELLCIIYNFIKRFCWFFLKGCLIYEDNSKAKFLNELVQHILVKNDIQDYLSCRIYLVRSDEVNAYSIPGNIIVVNDQLLDIC